MEELLTLAAARDYARREAQAGSRVVLVPTMGGLHEGHRSLIRLAHENGDRVVVSIFVNPTQFGPHEDYTRYPRTPEQDLETCREEKVHAVFMPSAEDMYAPSHSIYVVDDEIGHILEGESRRGHFRGVLTVVAKLFLAVQPQAAVFGRKDAQQLWLIRRMVRDLNFPVELIEADTVRESDGLALSSRNVYLTEDHRQQAVCLSQALRVAAERFQAGERNAYLLRKDMMDVIDAHPDAEMDYIEIVDAESFAPVTSLLKPALALLAVRVGNTRLIDNAPLAEGVDPI